MHVLAQIVLANQNGIVKDSFVNTLAFERVDDATSAQLAALADQCARLYTDTAVAQGAAASLGVMLGSQVSRTANACKVNLYNITGKEQNGPPDANGNVKPPAHGSPIHVHNFTVPAAEYPNSLPNQVAAVVTFRSRTALESPVEDGNVRPRQRGTGRIYFGPINEGGVTNNATNPRCSARLMDNLCAAFEELQDEVDDEGWAHSVWSRTRGMLSVVTSVEVDNSFDIIRSRKIQPTFRTKRVYAPVPALALGA